MLGIGIMLIGVLVSASTRTTVTGDLGVGESISVGDTTLTVLSITTTPGAGTVDMPGHGIVPESIDTLVTYSISGQAGTSNTLLKYFPVPDEFFSIPSIYGSSAQDVYVVASATASVERGECPGLPEWRFGNPCPRRRHGSDNSGHLARLDRGGAHAPGEPLLCS